MSVVPEQLFIAKSKEIIFAKPTADALVKGAILDEQKTLNLTIQEWKEKFKIIKQVTKNSSNVKTKSCKEEKLKMEMAKNYKTPLKRRDRETLEDEDAEEYRKMDVNNKLTLEKAQELFYKID